MNLVTLILPRLGQQTFEVLFDQRRAAWHSKNCRRVVPCALLYGFPKALGTAFACPTQIVAWRPTVICMFGFVHFAALKWHV